MNFSDIESPLLRTDRTKDKMALWVESQCSGAKARVDVYGKPTDVQLQELERVRNLSKELQDNLQVSFNIRY
ncbi:unnamed protein product [Leptosia nina]|uniref:Uncharacterized protein n=1 Tax=Leptosia nina TaxID=320188 RepID=A0AAV1JD82_9NEOP